MQAVRPQSADTEQREPGARSVSSGASHRRRPEFFLETEAWSEAFAAATAAMQAGATAVLIEGDGGSGKSVFLSRLAATVPSACVLELRHPLGEAGLLSRLAQAFGAAADGPTALGAAIARRADGGVLVAVDDAHHLSPFALRALLDLQRTAMLQGGRLALVLSAAPGEVQRRIAHLPSFAPFREDALTVFSLPTLTDSEGEEYLRVLMERAGRPPLDAQQARALVRLARGLPGHLDRVAADLQRGVRPRPWRKTRGQASRRRVLQAEWWAPAAIGAATVAAIFLGYRVLFMPSNDLLSVPLARIEPVATEVTVDLSRSGTESPEAEVTMPAPPSSGTPASGPGALSVTPAPPTPPAPASLPAASAPAAAAQPQAATPPASRAPAPVDDRTWLMGQDARRYTIQLASAPDEERARQFIARHSLPARTIAISTVRGSFIVLHGSFATHAEAQQAIAGFPPALRRNDPFARRIESVRELMSAN
ncbi:MAG: AAA family ATPase [Gammaproteobacteria bacterium]|nr:AAA family ATPase [Gammaproteobacteria bacterium]